MGNPFSVWTSVSFTRSRLLSSHSLSLRRSKILLLYWIFGALSSPFRIGLSSFWTEWATRWDFDSVSSEILDFLPRKRHLGSVQKYNKSWSALDCVHILLRVCNYWQKLEWFKVVFSTFQVSLAYIWIRGHFPTLYLWKDFQSEIASTFHKYL